MLPYICLYFLKTYNEVTSMKPNCDILCRLVALNRCRATCVPHVLCDVSPIDTLLLSFREEMAGLQSNIDFLSNKLEASFEAQEWKGNSKLGTTKHNTGFLLPHFIF